MPIPKTIKVNITRKSDDEIFHASLDGRGIMTCDGLPVEVVREVQKCVAVRAMGSGLIKVGEIKYAFRLLRREDD